ncbi:hypothetical protein FIBSPDRAFT_858374 [Athelia psychrophila]|uniref:Vps72/YL1 C-terminal domain-containing protein n=1 Tax=Athelia psychrophila TaxID=1759441 RepID=A0A166LXQ9_9AGAM|nr:hypothetical protein FIBSPDRAFT_858374 [Fibularhizoctonia sp. CBS 109695]
MRLKQTCTTTGLPAPYLDPRTGMPFATVRASEVLTHLLNHEGVWSGGWGAISRGSERT